VSPSRTRARLRRAVRRETFGIDVPAALNLVGTLVTYFSPAFLVPAAVALGYGESPWPFVVAGAVTAVVGLSLERSTKRSNDAGHREGFVVVALVWALIAVLGAIPYLLSGNDELTSPANAVFESMSGFTTTGSSVITDLTHLDRGMLMWRQFTQWLGGAGIVVLALAILPRLRVGGRGALFHAEAPASEFGDLATTIRDTARRFVVLYAALTATQIVVLAVIGWTGLDDAMNLYEAVAHSFATLSTGGFSTRARSLGEFGAITQWVTVVFMILGATNFALLYVGIVRRRPRAFARDDEFRAYVLVLVAGSVVLFSELVRAGLHGGEEAARHAAFTTVSIVTTTGFASTDFNIWTAVTAFTIFGLMFVGGSAGSTGGGIKVVRHLVIAKMLRRELDLTVHPEIVAPVRVYGRGVDERALRDVVVFAFIYVGVVAAGAFVVLLDSAGADLVLTPFQALAAAATALGNVGPSFGFAGPYGSFAPFSDLSTWALTALMWLGRLEILPVLVLFTRQYWRA